MAKFRIRKRENINFNSPQEMYDDYKNRQIKGLQDYQSKVIDNYMNDCENYKDISIELPTGTGKTLVGLLIAEYRRKKFKEKVVYLCPTNQLVKQTSLYAKNVYGIRVTGFTGSARNYEPNDKGNYTTGKTIAITNYSSFFNTNSFFKDADIIIFDDAHAGENYISSNWTVNVDRIKNSELYFGILDAAKDSIEEKIYNKYMSSNSLPHDMEWIDKIPNFKILNKLNVLRDQVNSYIHKENSDIKYSWSNIEDNLSACSFYLSYKEIVIRPFIPPTHTYKPFSDAKQRIYMSATPGKSGELERSFGVPKIHKLDCVKDWENKTIGRKYFMFPHMSFTKEQESFIVKKITEISNRTLMLVKDNTTRDDVVDFLEKNTNVSVFTSNDFDESKEKFINKDNSFAVLANRFDGIDFPNEECRMLILYDLPCATHIQEKFLISRMNSMSLFEERIKTRLVQALGRCTRGNTDYAAVCIFGDDLTKSLLSPSKLCLLNPELQAELAFGKDNSEDYESVDQYLELLDTFLHNRDEWELDAEKDIIDRRDELINEGGIIEKDSYKELKKSAKYEVKAQYSMWKEDFEGALDNIENILCILKDRELKGYRGYWAYLGSYCSYQLFNRGKKIFEETYKKYLGIASMSAISVTWFNTFDNTTIEKKENYMMEYVIDNIENEVYKDTKKNTFKYIKRLDEIIELLSSSDGIQFEKGHLELGRVLGYRVEKPKGDATPDPIWMVSDEICIVSEDKIYESINQKIQTKHVRQAASHPNWIKSRKNDLNLSEKSICINIFISNSRLIDQSARVDGENIYYVNRESFVEWSEKAITILKRLGKKFSLNSDLIWREEAYNEFISNNITPKHFIEMIQKETLNVI